MYTIKAGDVTIHNPLLADDKKVVQSPKMTEEVNQIGSLTFTMLPNHPYYDSIRKLSTLIYAYDDDGEIFRGRVIDHTNDFYKQKSVSVESDMAFFCDSVVRPFGYTGSVAGFVEKLVENHNAQVDDYKQFTLGQVTVTDPNDYIIRSSETPETTWQVMNDRCIDLLGGYFRTRYEGGVRYIDYLADYTDKNIQIIEFGKNLLNLEDYVDASGVATVLIPYGTKLDSSDPYYQEKPPENAEYHGNRITIINVNDGIDYVESETGIALYGKIWTSEAWDDVTMRSNLLAKAQERVEELAMLNTTLTIGAVDLHLINVSVEKIQLYQLVRVKSIPHDIDMWLPCTKISRSLSAADDTEITLGTTRRTLTEQIGR